VEAIPWPFSPPMPTAKSILFIAPQPVFYSARKFAASGANKQAQGVRNPKLRGRHALVWSFLRSKARGYDQNEKHTAKKAMLRRSRCVFRRMKEV